MVQARKVPDAVRSELNRLRVRLRRTAALRGLGHLLLIGSGTLLAALAADYLFDLNASTRCWLLAGQVLLGVSLICHGVIRPLLRRLTDEDIAAVAERQLPDLAERLTSLIELSDERLPESERGSPLMREMLERDAIEAVGHIDLRRAITSRRATRPAISGTAIVAIGLLWVLLFPESSRLLLARLANPGGNYESASSLTFVITPEDCAVGRGSNVAISASIAWKTPHDEPVPEPVTLQWESATGQSDQRELRFDADQNAFVTVLADLRESLRFRVAADGARSKAIELKVEDYPAIVTAKLDVSPPSYVGLPKQSYDGAAGEMLAFEHSQLSYHLTFNKPVESAELEWLGALTIPPHELLPAAASYSANDHQPDDRTDEISRRQTGAIRNELLPADGLPRVSLTLADDGLSASMQTSATVQGILAFRLEDQHGLRNADDTFRQLKIERDQPPQIEIAGGPQDSARPSDVYPLALRVSDDIGVEQLELRIMPPDGPDVIQTVSPDKLGGRQLTHRFLLDLAALGVRSGAVLRLQVRAADGRPRPCPNEVWSDVRHLAISDEAAAPGTHDLLARQEQLRTELQAIRAGLQQATHTSDELRKQAETAADDDAPFANAQQLTTLAQNEVELTGRLSTFARQLQKRPLFDRVAAEIERTATVELAPVVALLLDAREQPPGKLAELLHWNGDATDLAAEQLRELKQRFDRLAELEQDLLELNRIAGRAGQLAVDAKRLSELRAKLDSAEETNQTGQQTTGADSKAVEPLSGTDGERRRLSVVRGELAAAQQQLQTGHRELADELQELLDDRPEVLDAARHRQLQRLKQVADRTEQLADREDLLALAFQDAAPTEVSQPVGNSPRIASPGTGSRERSTTDQPTLEELLQQQRELSAAAAEIGLAAVETEGRESEAATAAIESALLAVQSQQQTLGGRFAEAARRARDTAEAARSSQAALASNQPALASRIADTAAGQHRLAAALQDLEESPTRRPAARLAQQTQVSDTASEITTELADLAETLGAEPLSMTGSALNARAAHLLANKATRLAALSADLFRDGVATEAAHAARQSAEALHRAATTVTEQRPDSSDASQRARLSGARLSGASLSGASLSGASLSGTSPREDIPGELATQVLSAAQQLMQAQRQIGEAIVADGLTSPDGLSALTGEVTRQSDRSQSSTGSPGENERVSDEPARPAGESATSQTAAEEQSKASPPGDRQQPQPANLAENSASAGDASTGEAAESSPGGPTGQDASPASDALRRAAQALAQVSDLLSEASLKFAPQNGQLQSGPGRGMSNGEDSQLASQLGSDGAGAAGFVDADSPLELQLRQKVMRDWGRLPAKLRTEILQSSDRQTNGEYAEIIKLYFEQIATEAGSQRTGSNEQRTGNSR